MAEEARRHREASAVRENQTALVQQRVRVVENELEQVKSEAAELQDFKSRVKGLIETKV